MMKHNSYNILFYILFWLFVFFDEFFFFILILTGGSAEEGMKTREVVLLSGTVLLFFLYDIINGLINTKTRTVLILLGILVLLYMLTPMFHSGNPPKFQSALLLFMAESIPASYIGARLGSSSISSLEKIDKLLPYFVIPISIILGIVGLTYARGAMMMIDDDSGLGYQSISYFMAYCYAYSAYYVFFSPQKGKRMHKLFKIIMLPDMFFCALICLVSGGRGAFVFIVFITLYIIWTLKSVFKRNFFNFIVIVISLGILFLWVASYFDIWNSRGMQRVSETLYYDEERIVLYKKAADAFLQSPLIGQGLGSVWFTVGYYSHNILMDMLAETGIVGAIFFVFVLLRTFLTLYKNIRYNSIFILFTIIFLGALIKNSFSGYYLGAYKLFMFCSFVYVLNRFRVTYKQTNNKSLK